MPDQIDPFDRRRGKVVNPRPGRSAGTPDRRLRQLLRRVDCGVYSQGAFFAVTYHVLTGFIPVLS